MMRAIILGLSCLLFTACTLSKPFISSVPTAIGVECPRSGWNERFQSQTKYAKDVLKFTPQHYTKLCFLGDSLTEGFVYGRDDVIGVWEEYFKPLDAMNYGISGDRTQHLLYRQENGAYFKGFAPRVIVIMIGINNLLGDNDTPEDTLTGIRANVHTARLYNPQAQIILCSLLPARWPEALPRIAQVNAGLPEICQKYDADFLDLTPEFTTQDGAVKTNLFLKDRLHLTREGYVTWSIALRKFFETSVK